MYLLAVTRLRAEGRHTFPELRLNVTSNNLLTTIR
jgi:hypothetical protein